MRRSLIPIAGLVASLTLTTGPRPAEAQAYDGYYNYYPPYNGYYYPPPSYGGYYPRHYYRHYYYPRYYHHYYAHYYHPYYGYGYASCGYRRHRAGAIGAVSGTIGGGIIGAAITHGNPAYTMVGAGLGALTGGLIGAHSHPYPC